MSTEENTSVHDTTPVEGAEAEDLAQAIDEKLMALMEDDTDEPDASTRYHECDGGFAYMVRNKDKDADEKFVPKRFTNFVAEIKEVRRINSGFVNSDGIPEATTDGESFLGIEPVEEILKERYKDDLKTIREKVVTAIETFLAGDPMSDDVTLMLLRRSS